MAGLVSALATVRRWLIALLLLLAAYYGIIAAGRAPLLPMFGLTLEAGAIQLRYHYLGPAVIAAILCLLFNELRQSWPSMARRLNGLLIVGAAAVLIADFSATAPIDHHSSARSLTESVLERIDFLAGKASAEKPLYIWNRTFPPALGLRNDWAAFPGWAAVFIIAHKTSVVHFVERDLRFLAAVRLHPHTPIASVLAAPDEVPPGVPVL